MIISLIVAMAVDGVIGRDNGLPWRLSTDLKRFKALSIGKPVVMGRKCFDSIGKALPGRPNIVITRNPDFRAEGVHVAHSVEEGLEKAKEFLPDTGRGEVCVIGGGEIYRESMKVADRLYVTHVLASVEGDTFFPAIDPAIWIPASEERVPAGDKDEYPTRYVVYDRRAEA